MGDPAGISPELTAKLLALDEARAAARIVAFGDRRVLDQGAEVAALKLDVSYVRPGEAFDASARPVFVDLGHLDPATVKRCEATPVGGAYAIENFRQALSMACAGKADAVCFTPFNKQAMRYVYPGYEDEIKFIAEVINFPGTAREFNILEGLWNARVTSHIPLADVASALTQEIILDELELADRCLREAGFANPRIAVADARIKAVTLTGSERAGRSVAATAGAHLKKCVMELGGSDPFVVLADADLDAALPIALSSRFGNAGQTCIAAKRFILVDAIADAFIERFVAGARALSVGDPNVDATTLAPMARVDLRTAVHQQVLASVAKGARLLCGGQPLELPTAYPATIVDGVAPGMPAYHEELFGPAASILRVADEAEAARVANDTSFGLGASVWTRDAERGERFARGIAAGAVFVNALVRSDVRMPFGGTKASGFGRELAQHGIHEFMNIKTIYVA